ncbi:hypothetical protein GJ744_006796 [Endocarpon pusillum]|uniref:Pre-mRNA-processing factor 19 n=1 Tax=Endocarpon pusillum TaxID=364733 RepID=A0A8H7AJL3_9EURO|nr:hypothetical protein GJ744_006796 [Endocarpon pusillum]
MLCAISGEAPQVPVASRKSGTIYEKRLIEGYISENGTEPATGEDLTLDDLIELRTSRIVRPRPPTLTSIPSLLGVFQEEWDALTLETYTLKQNLAQTRQELSTALYQHDAAVRVIARLTRERDEAREALSKVSIGSRAAPTNGDAMQVDSTGLPEALIAKVDETKAMLEKTRRKRPIPEEWATSEEISTFKPQRTSEPLYPGGRLLSINEKDDLALVGGSDGIAGVYSMSENRVLHALKVGGGSITSGVWAGPKAVISTSAGRVKVFERQEEAASFSTHAGEATAVALHPSGDIIASVGVDKSYVLYDLTTSAVATQVYSNTALVCVQFHPDGHLLAAGGEDGQIKLFDIKTGAQAATFDLNAALKTLYFSENGIWLAAVTERSTTISIWDLRKMAEIKSLDTGSGRIDSISWDYTGQFLLTGGPGGLTVQHYSKASKAWSEPLKSAVPAVAVAWGKGAHKIAALDERGVVTVLGGP